MRSHCRWVSWFRFVSSLPVIPVHVGKKIVARLDFAKPFFVHARQRQLLVQRDETQQVVFHAAARIIGARPGTQNERPVARLREQQFARSLFQGARLQAGGLGKFFHQIAHALLRDLQVRINPFVRLVEPDAPVTFLAPARRAGRGNLIGRVVLQIFAGREQGAAPGGGGKAGGRVGLPPLDPQFFGSGGEPPENASIAGHAAGV